MTTNQLNRWLRRVGGRSPGYGQQGLTLIECLVAIIMVGLVSSAIAPALVISVATRVQSQKAEQALELAQSEIDRVRLLVERGEATDDNLPPSVAFTGDYSEDNEVAQVPGPQYGTPEETREDVASADQTFKDSLDPDDPQFALQVYRTPGLMVGDVPVTFGLGVRVYDYETVVSGGAGNLAQDTASLKMVSGQGQRSTRPLVALYTNVTAGESGNSLCQYIENLDNTASVPTGCQ